MVTALVVPHALGYATIAGVAVQVGLYAIPVVLVAYALFGSCPHVSVGPISTVSVVSGSIVAAQSGGGPDRAVAPTVTLALPSGLFLVAAGPLRTAWVAGFLSKPIVSARSALPRVVLSAVVIHAVEEQAITAVDRTDGVRALILDLEATDQLGTTSTDMLHHLRARLRRHGVDLHLVRDAHGVEGA